MGGVVVRLDVRAHRVRWVVGTDWGCAHAASWMARAPAVESLWPEFRTVMLDRRGHGRNTRALLRSKSPSGPRR